MQATQAIILAVQPGYWEERLWHAREVEQDCKAALNDAQWRLDAATERYDQTNSKQARGEYTTAPYRLLLAVQEAQETRDQHSTAVAMARGQVLTALGEMEFDRWWQAARHRFTLRPRGAASNGGRPERSADPL